MADIHRSHVVFRGKPWLTYVEATYSLLQAMPTDKQNHYDYFKRRI